MIGNNRYTRVKATSGHVVCFLRNRAWNPEEPLPGDQTLAGNASFAIYLFCHYWQRHYLVDSRDRLKGTHSLFPLEPSLFALGSFSTSPNAVWKCLLHQQEQLLVRAGGWSARRDAYARAHARARGPAAWYYGTLYWILVEYTSHQYRTTVKIRPICNFSLILKFPFTPRIYFTTQSDCEVSSKVTVLGRLLKC